MVPLCLAGCAAAAFAPGGAPAQTEGIQGLRSLRFRTETQFRPVEARHYEKLPQNKIRCKLCPHECAVADAERGTCGVRENAGGKYYTLVYSRVCSAHVDPVEKKPLFHFKPGTKAFSIATPGCNFDCRYCQNWQISQFRPEQVDCVTLTPEQAVAVSRQESAGAIAFTYSEPVVFYEYASDVAAAARKAGLKSVMITNGYIRTDPLKELIPKLDAIKVDFKGFSENFYSRICGGKLKPVLEALTTIAKSGLWLELVMLVVPTLNDSAQENADMFRWVRDNLGPLVPVHLTRFHPTYRLPNLPPTPLQTLDRLYASARQAGLKYVYLGNVAGHPSESTSCHQCGGLLIRRVGFQVVANNMSGGRCPLCRTAIPGVWR